MVIFYAAVCETHIFYWVASASDVIARVALVEPWVYLIRTRVWVRVALVALVARVARVARVALVALVALVEPWIYLIRTRVRDARVALVEPMIYSFRVLVQALVECPMVLVEIGDLMFHQTDSRH